MLWDEKLTIRTWTLLFNQISENILENATMVKICQLDLQMKNQMKSEYDAKY